MEKELVKRVNGIDITRWLGTKAPLFVNIENESGVGFKEFHSFKRLKDAVEFCESITK